MAFHRQDFSSLKNVKTRPNRKLSKPRKPVLSLEELKKVIELKDAKLKSAIYMLSLLVNNNNLVGLERELFDNTIRAMQRKCYQYLIDLYNFTGNTKYLGWNQIPHEHS